MTYPQLDYSFGSRAQRDLYRKLQRDQEEAMARFNPERSNPYAYGLLGGQLYSPSWARTLNVSPDATVAEIKAAYRAKAKTLHSDAGGSDEAMAKLNVARDEALKARKAA